MHRKTKIGRLGAHISWGEGEYDERTYEVSVVDDLQFSILYFNTSSLLTDLNGVLVVSYTNHQ